METTHNPPRAGHLAYVLSICLLGFSSIVFSQPTVTVRFANPSYDCALDQYCADVEFRSNQQDVQVFGMNVRFFYDDDVLELIGFSDYQGGYGPVSPNPPEVFTNGPAGPALFNFMGPAEFINGAIQLLDSAGGIPLDTLLWTKLFQICFTVEDTNPDVENFCPSLVWDLEQDPANGGFNTGDDGVVITVVDPDPLIESAPSLENVVQFNWIYIGPGTPPYGMPVETECTSINCIGHLSVLKTDTLLIGDCLEPGDSILYDITVINEGIVTISNITVSDPGTIGLDCIPAIPFSLDPGDTVTCTAVHILTQGNINAGSYSNIATATGTNPDTVMVSDNSDDPADTTDIDPNMDGNPDDPTVTPLPFSEISLIKTDILDYGANGTLEPGDVILYSITVTNTGNQLISNITLSDPNATGLSCIPATPFSVAPGASVSCSASHVVTQPDIDAGFYENSATATGQNPAGDPVTDVSDDPDDLTDIDPNGDCNPDDPTVTLLEPTPIIIVRFSNPHFNCLNEEYCLDVEFMSDTDSLELFGMNVRFFYDDDILELIDFRDYQGGYGPVSPDPPIVSTSAFAGPAFFNFGGPADFVNGAIQLTDNTQPPIYLSTTGWTKIFQVCFMVDDSTANLDTFCPPVVWDLEVDPLNGGFLIGDDGVVMTIVDPDSIQMSVPVTENVVQFNWQYSGPGTPPYGEPIELECTSINCFPMLTCAADITIECDDSTDPSVTGFATSSDNCEGDSTITFTDTLIAGSCPPSYTITRTWIVINACDLSDTCIQMITVVDTTAPILLCPADTIIECTASTLPDSTGFATATDNCDTLPEITFSDSIATGSCPQEMIITRTWVATDTCGNSSSCNQIISVVDTVSPAITCPGDITIECDASTSPDNTGIASAIDNCDTAVVVTSSDVTIAGSCPQEYTIQRTWTATDACGNSSACLQTISVADNTPPVITCPVDLILACTDTIPTDTATAIDNCSGVIAYSYSDIMCDNPVMGFTDLYDFSNWTIILPPQGGSVTPMGDSEVMLVSPDLTVSCNNASVLFQIVITSTGQLVFDWNYQTNDSDGPSFDPFGYNLNGTFFMLSNNSGPDTQSGTTSVAVTAGDVFAFEQRSTDCIFGEGATTVVEFFACIEQAAEVCTQLIIRTHTAADECGNEASCVQTIFVVDTIGPIITCPPNLTIECTASTLPDSTGFATATDNCDTLPTITFGDVSVAGSCPQESTITRTWLATDACGNSSSCVQIIQIIDTLPPVITCPADTLIECTASTLPDITGTATATDDCDALPAITFGDVTVAGSCPQEYMITRTWTATDTCGNSSSCIQIIQIIDTLPPVITCPPNLTIECTASTLADSTGMATATDNCDTLPSVTFGDVTVAGLCPQAYMITRTWVATDTCGNSSSCVQTIFVIDTTPPAITCPPDLSISFGQSTSPDSTGIPTVTDNCDGSPTITSNDVTIESPCTVTYVIERTWTATDSCGNSSTCLQIIMVQGDCGVDLALEKTLNAGQDNLQPGDDVSFTIEVTNEGEVTMGEIHVVDYIPIGFALNDADWTAGTDGSTGQSGSIILSVANGYLPVGGLLASQSVSIEITLHINDNIPQGVYENFAEISVEIDINGIDVSTLDIDSDPDTDDTNDPEAEDDHDGAIVCLLEPPIILGSLFVCPGDLVIYSVGDYNPNFTYIFTLVNGGGQIIGTTPSSITVSWGDLPGGPFEISLTVMAGPDCQDSSSVFVNIEGGEPVACIDHINLSIDNECGTVVLSGMILTGEEAGNNTFQVFIIDMNGDTVPNATLTFEHVGQTFKVSIRSVCTGQSCWGFLTVEDKLPPIINCVCPVNNEDSLCEINCLQVDEFLNGDIPEELRPIVVDNCGGTTLEVINVEYSFATCTNGFIRVTWKATDTGGNTSTCEQEFDIVPISLATLQFPPDYVGECGGSTDPSVTGWPQVEGMDLIAGAPICNLLVSYWDRELPLCGGGKRILRTWTIMDWCVGQVQQYVQTIKIADHIGPLLTCPANMTVSTDVWFCYANVIVPKPIAIDQCSDIASYKLTSSAGTVVVNGNTYIIQALPIGTHTARWTVKDECDNSSTCSFQITVEDHVPPTVSCGLHTVVGLSDERPNGVTLVEAESFNDGSFDNCGDVFFRVRRMDSCIDFDWTTGGACVDDTPGGIPPINEYDLGTVRGACVPFACCDVGQPGIMVELEVTDEAGNVNYCMVEVDVQDKLAPELICPPEIFLSCEYLLPDIQEGLFRDAVGNQDGTLDEDPLSEIFGNMYDGFRHTQAERQHIIIHDPDNPNVTNPHDWGLDGWASDNCESSLSVVVDVIDDCSGSSFPGHYPAGAVKLIERRFIGNDGVQSGSCLQRIWVIDFDRFTIQDTTCNNDDPFDGVIWPCDVLITTCPDEPEGTGVPIILNDGCSIIGISHEDARFDFVDSVCYKILRTWKVLDWCQFDANTGYGLWTYVQTIKVADGQGAEFLDAPSEPPAYCVNDPGITLPANNQMFLGENDPDASSCSVHVNQNLHVHETCSSSVLYDVKLYLFNGPDFIQLVPETMVALDANHDAELNFNTENSTIPSIHDNGLPYTSSFCDDYHRVLWSVEDGCGNRSYADYLFRLEDCKNPTPVCIDGITSVIMPPEGEVTIFANSFNASSFDDCTPGDELLFSFSGNTYQPSFTYTCDNVPDFGVEITVEIWAADAGVDHNCNGQIEWSERNKDFCTATIIITDNGNVCDEPNGLLEGEILTAFTDAVGNVSVNLSSPGHTFPAYVTAQDGKFSFANVPVSEDYIISPARSDNYRNGVSTLDLVVIQKHLLGIDIFSSPYQYIAADANNSKSVSAIDLIEIRKLILGLQDEFSSNQSWRFVRAGIPMAPGNPWPFDETIEINNLSPDFNTDLDFVGVKIGDVNNTVQANATQILPRGSKKAVTVKATSNGNMEVGELIEVELEFSEKVSGFQWTLETTGLEYAGISSDDIVINDQNVGLLGNGLITMSWNGDVSEDNKTKTGMSLTLTFKVTQAGKFIQMINLNSKITAAEAYTQESEIMNVNLTFNSTGVFADFALFQNKPNPWNNQTVIGFHLPNDAPATLTIYDINGKVLKTISGDYKAGYNSVTLSVKDIPASGVLYYRLDSGAYTANKKMIVIQ